MANDEIAAVSYTHLFSGTMEEIFGGDGFYTPVSSTERIANVRAHLNSER